MSGQRRLLLLLVVVALAASIAGVWSVGSGVVPPEQVDASRPGKPAPGANPGTPAPPSVPVQDRTLAPRALPVGGVRVRVVDDHARGVADIAVAMTFALPGRADEPQAASGRTDAEGSVDLVADAETLTRLRMLGVNATFAVGVDVPLADAPRAVLGHAPTAAAEVTLRLPSFGSAVARVLDPSGTPIDDGGDVFLFWREPGSDGRWDRIGTPRASSRGGHATLMAVPLGKDLLLRASGTERLQSGEVIVRGPQSAGEVVRVDLRLGLPWAFLTGRLVDEHGAPFVRPQVAMGLGLLPADAVPDAVPAGVDTTLRWTRVDPEGRFRVRAGLDVLAGRRRALVVEHTDADREATRKAVVSLPDTLTSGVDFEVGAVVFAAAVAERILCTGRVVDAAGQGLPGIDIHAGYHDPATHRWVGLHHQRLRTDAQGDFAVRSALPAPSTFTLSASGGDRAPMRVELGEGSHRVLVLARGGRLEARIRAPAGVPAQLLVGAIVDAEGRSREPNQLGGAFGASNLAPGRYDVVVRIAESGVEIARVTGIVVSEGEKVDDPRIAPIDVTDRCRALRLRLLDVAAEPLRRARVHLTAPVGRGSAQTADRDGRLLVVVPVPTPALRVSLDDGRHAEIRAGVAEQIVTLRE